MSKIITPPLGIATGSNRINSSGPPPADQLPTLGSIPLNITLAAAGSKGSTATQAALGSSFYISGMSTVASVQIQPTGGDQGTYTLGTGQDFNGRAAFASLTITNPNAFAVTLVIEIGFPTFIDRRLVLSTGSLTASLPTRDATTLNKGYGPISIGSGAILSLPGTGIAGLQRRQLVVFNTSATNSMLILDGSSNQFGAIPPAQSWTFDGSDTWIIQHPNGSSVTVIPGETSFDD